MIDLYLYIGAVCLFMCEAVFSCVRLSFHVSGCLFMCQAVFSCVRLSFHVSGCLFMCQAVFSCVRLSCFTCQAVFSCVRLSFHTKSKIRVFQLNLLMTKKNGENQFCYNGYFHYDTQRGSFFCLDFLFDIYVYLCLFMKEHLCV